MTAAGLLLVTVVTGVLLAVTAIAANRFRRGESYTPGRWSSGAPAERPDGTVVGAAVVVALVVAVVAWVIADPLTVALMGGPALVVAFLTWGVYTLARSRGLPRAHSLGLSTWVIGVVLIGVIAVQLLVG
jgi:hypothetical protein